jgi:molybdopterin-guanine dinucleotide biosynthesis protein A
MSAIPAKMPNARAPLYGLVLAGGASSRMGRDKAAIDYHGRTQLQCAFDLLNSVCERSFISVRADQQSDPTRASLPQITDRHENIGPLAGIGAAFESHPGVAWLVLACDLPFLARETLMHLIDRRNPSGIATTYRSAHDGLPEPLCAIWEPASREPVLQWIAADKRCPRKLLINFEATVIEQPNGRALDNINTPEEFAAARTALQSS